MPNVVRGSMLTMQPSTVIHESRLEIAEQPPSDGVATGRYIHLQNGRYSLGEAPI